MGLPLPPARNAAPRSGIFASMRSNSRFYRGHRIKAVQLDDVWHATVYAPRGSIVRHIEITSLADATAQAEWAIETRLKFQPPSRGERRVVSASLISQPFGHLSTKHA